MRDGQRNDLRSLVSRTPSLSERYIYMRLSAFMARGRRLRVVLGLALLAICVPGFIGAAPMALAAPPEPKIGDCYA